MPDQRPVVLVVDDQPTNVTILANALQTHYRVKPATNGPDALALAHLAPVPEVILLDVMMPGMDGYAVCSALKQDPATAAIPVIFITAQTDAASETLALEGGAVDFIHKPVNPMVVQVRVRLHRELAQHRQHLEDLVQARTLDLAQARDAAESANRAKTAFLHNASHEMLTPLNHITGMSYLIGSELPSGRAQERLATIDQAAHQLLTLVKRLLDFSQLEADELELELRSFGLMELLQQVLEGYRQQAAVRGITLDLVLDPDLPEALVGDPKRLGQILAQLLDNAVKFSGAGQIRVSLETGRRAGSGIEVRFVVSDQGPGLPPDVAAAGPRRFRQGDESLTREYGGLGLGLVFCERLIRLMGGELHLDSTPGEGTSVVFTLLLGIAEGAETAGPDQSGGSRAGLPK